VHWATQVPIIVSGFTSQHITPRSQVSKPLTAPFIVVHESPG
jgi:hypothetical protein